MYKRQAADQLRLDNDITDSKVTIGTKIRFVGGPGAGQSATVLSYDQDTQTATIDSQVLTNITSAGSLNREGSTIYSVGELESDDYLASSAVTAGSAGTVSGVLHQLRLG